MAKEPNKVKAFSLNFPLESWRFIKVKAVELDMSMTRFIIKCVEDHQKSLKIIEEYKNESMGKSVKINSDELEKIMKTLKNAQNMIE